MGEIDLHDFEQFCLLGEEGLEPECPVGRLNLDLEGKPESIAIILVCLVGDRVLVAIPHKAWHRRAANRLLPAGTLEKPLSLEVAACSLENRQEALPGGKCKIWVGFLARSWFSSLDFDSDEAAILQFVSLDSEEVCAPFGEALQAIAGDKFHVAFVGNTDPEPADRLNALESQVAQIRSGLDALLAAQGVKPTVLGDEPGFQTAEEVEVQRPSRLATPPGLGALPKAPARAKDTRTTALPGLDPGTVAAALQSGIPMSHLQAMSTLMQGKPARFGDVPERRPAVAAKAADPLDDDAEAAEDIDGEPLDPVMDPVAKAVVQLTHIVNSMNKQKGKKETLEESLDAMGGQSSGSADQPAVIGKKHVKAIEALKQALRKEPQVIYNSIEKLMAEDYGLMGHLPNASLPNMTARGWAEHRSRIQGFPRTVRWVWGVCGILDCLRNSNPEEARARACLMLAQAEQEAIDKGNYLLAQEMSLEPPPPYASFNAHVIPDPMEIQFTRIMDGRWIDAFAAKLRDADEYIESRRKLGQRGVYAKETGNLENPLAKAKAKFKPKSKGKGDGEQGDS
eukprot:s207_g3.t1